MPLASRIFRIVFALLITTCVGLRAESADPRSEVEATERAFAATMAERSHDAFTSYLSDEALFVSGSSVLRGKARVAEAWKPFFDGTEAPFSWEPEIVEVLDSGSLALSSGPVYDARGVRIATFNSIWRQEEPGVWRIVFDKGSDACPDVSEGGAESDGPDVPGE
jgi:ketosteroid isomerase-like protein